MRKVLLLIAVLFGTSVMVSAKPLVAKSATAKEVKMSKHKKHHKAKKADKKSAEAGTAGSSSKK